ncbi:MAG: hypothetical protein Unbinned3459contig1002_19 [Prokaryotic dsDNA virus sp.]|jgi:hypothetical protein|nr:MAG: hypothetical protein Unbinned3459contig1002_19 [Prokaryotic dsDNA virus sp.]|tara:strand:- start:346 stop:621 length:276 start_codon:yes stop_codon:yes gene_type:complete
MRTPIEYGSEGSQNTAKKRLVLEGKGLAPLNRDYKLFAISEGYEPAGSMLRWTDAVYSVEFYFDGARHGKRFKSYDKARDEFYRLLNLKHG